jgi:hypothetical protein
MTQIDEKQEAIAKIRMMIDNDAAAREAEISNIMEGDELPPNLGKSVWAAPDNVSGHSPHWIFGSPENPTNSRILETEMSAHGDASFKEFDERIRDFLSLLYLPDEAIRYEDPIQVILNTYILSLLLTSYLRNRRSGYINVFMSSTNRWKTGRKLVTSFDATTNFMGKNDTTVSFQRAAAPPCSFHG